LRRFSIAPRRLIPLLLLLLLVVALATACTDPMSTIDPKSDNTRRVQDLYVLVFWAATIVFVGVMAAALIFSFMYRERPGRTAQQIHGNTRLEIVWTLIPVVILAVIAVPTFDTVIKTTGDAPEGALEVIATGHQWWFEFEYPELGVTTANEMHVPVGRAVNVKLRSVDVIHSFWVPQLTGKTDMVPGHDNRLWFTPEVEGEFRAQCAEFCGTSHANMRFRVFVRSQGDFEAWVANQKKDRVAPTADLAKQGEQVFLTGACVGCHVVRGTAAAARVGPELTHVGERTTIASALLDNTPENMARWLRNPPAAKPGSKMPNLNLTEDQIQKLVAYLESLK